MSNAQHTPGPWKAAERGDYGDFGGNSRVVIGDDAARAAIAKVKGES